MASLRHGARKPYSRPPPRDTNVTWVHDKAPGGFQTEKSAPPKGMNVINAPLNTKLVISNLHYEITAKDLGDIFGKIGTLVREPHIRYDASGRSTGVAIVTFETSEEANEAKRQYDGKLAKGQNIKVAFDTFVATNKKRSASAPSTASLLNRIQKAPLKERLSQDDTALQSSKQRGSGVGPIRSRGGQRGAGPRPRGGRKPQTAEDLDKELDAFMLDTSTTGAPSAKLASSGEAPAAPSSGDVDMV